MEQMGLIDQLAEDRAGGIGGSKGHGTEHGAVEGAGACDFAGGGGRCRGQRTE